MIKLPERYTRVNDPVMGGFGEVFFCKDNHLDRKVAIKFIQNEKEKLRLRDELSALLQMRSKHVVQVFDIVIDDVGTFGIVEEFIDGVDLWNSEFPRQSPDNYLKTLWQISSGIADIHTAGVIHRDIKPNNMKIDSEGIVKIFDFGLARNEGTDAATKGFKGTPGFAAPELFGNGTIGFTNAIDTYAFGATAIFLAFKDLPTEIKKLPPQPLISGVFSSLPFAIPADLTGLLEKCLAYECMDRPPIDIVRNELARQLLRDKHQALAVHKRKPYFFNAKNRSAILDYPTVGKIEITYDGLKFFVSETNGEVFINNSPVVTGVEIPGSCVVALGGAQRKNDNRAFITFDVSNPEVVL